MILAIAIACSPLAAAKEAPLGPMQILQSAAELLQKSNGFAVHVEKEFDVVQYDGVKVRHSGALDIEYREGLGLHVDYGDDLSAKQFWYDGKSATLLDTLSNIYVSVPAEGTVEQVLDAIETRHDVKMPLASILKKDIYADAAAAVVRARTLGIHDVDGVPCHHLLLQGEEEDWQVWIDAGKQPLFRKMVIDFRDLDGAPQQTILLTDWDLNPKFSAKSFAAVLPKGAIRTEFVKK